MTLTNGRLLIHQNCKKYKMALGRLYLHVHRLTSPVSELYVPALQKRVNE